MLRILVTDDHALVRRGLRQVIVEAFGGGVTIEEAKNAQEALDHIWKSEWDLALMDISMPGRSGLDILKDVQLARPKLPVLFLTMHEEDQFAIRVLKAGAAGFITKESSPEEMVKAIRKTLGGGRYVSDNLAEKLALGLASDPDKRPHELLSDREFQVLCRIASGRTATQIAVELALSVKTVSTYRARILEKMSLETNAELTTYAIRNKLVD
jgi:two-component system, NarL family, invasion response regulator UvrY